MVVLKVRRSGKWIESKKTIRLRAEIASRNTNPSSNGGKKIYNCSSTLQSVRSEILAFCINKTLGVNVFEEKGIIPFLNAILHFLRLSSSSSAFLRDRTILGKIFNADLQRFQRIRCDIFFSLKISFVKTNE